MTPPGDAPTSDIDPSFRDSSLPIEDRVERLLAQMTVPEKAGLFFHSMISIGPDGELGEGNPAFGIPSPDDLVAGRQINHFNLLGPLLDATVAAGWHRPVPLPAEQRERILDFYNRISGLHPILSDWSPVPKRGGC